MSVLTFGKKLKTAAGCFLVVPKLLITQRTRLFTFFLLSRLSYFNTMYIITVKKYGSHTDVEEIIDVVNTFDDLENYIRELFNFIDEYKLLLHYKKNIPTSYSIPFAVFLNQSYNVRRMEFVNAPSFQ